MKDTQARRAQDRGETSSGSADRPLGLLLLLMAMTSIGPTSLNTLVPAIPRLSTVLGSNVATLQLAISLYLLALAFAQLVMGPLSDRFGRRPVLLAGMAAVTLSSLAAVAVANVEALIVARIVQAAGASTGIVVGRAIIRDLFGRDSAASVIGLVATVMVVVPTFGPLIGGVLDTAFGWEAIFLFTATVSFAVLIWIYFTLPETRGLNAASAEQAGFWRDLAALSGDRGFWRYVLAAALGSAPFFVFLGGGPHVVVTLMDRTPAEYGVWFAMSSIGYMCGNFVSSRLAVKHGIVRLIWWGICFELAAVALAMGLALFAHGLGPAIVFVPQMICNFGNGLLLPGAIAGAVSIRPQAAGTAAGIAGCTQMAFGAAMNQYSGMLLAGAASAVPLAVLMNAVGLGLLLSFLTLRPRH